MYHLARSFVLFSAFLFDVLCVYVLCPQMGLAYAYFCRVSEGSGAHLIEVALRVLCALLVCILRILCVHSLSPYGVCVPRCVNVCVTACVNDSV